MMSTAQRPFQMTLDESGVIRLVWDGGVAINEAIARRALADANDLCGSGKLPLLVAMATTSSVDRPARAVFAEPCKPSRIALLGSSAVDRLIANFVLGVNKPPHPIKFFGEEAAALAWLNADRAH